MISRSVSYAHNLLRSKTAYNLFWVFSGNGVSIILAVAATAIIGRLGQANLGIFLALFSFASLVADLVEVGLSASLNSFIPKLLSDKKQSSVQKILSTAFYTQLIIGLVICGFILISSTFLAQILFDHTAIINIYLTVLLIFSLLLFNFMIFALSAHKLFQQNALVNISSSIIRLVLLVILLLTQTLTLQNVLFVQVVSLFFSFIYGLVHLGTGFMGVKPDVRQAKELLTFSSSIGLQKVFVAISSRLDILMLVSFVGSFTAGIYGAAMRFAQIYPYGVSAFGQVLAPTFAEFSTKKDALAFLKRTGIVTGFFIVSLFGLFIFANPIVSLPFGKTYESSIPVFRALLIAMIPFIIAAPLNSLLVYTLKKPAFLALATLLQLLCIFIVNIFSIPVLKEYGPVLAIGTGNLVVMCISSFATWYYIRKL